MKKKTFDEKEKNKQSLDSGQVFSVPKKPSNLNLFTFDSEDLFTMDGIQNSISNVKTNKKIVEEKDYTKEAFENLSKVFLNV